jgi:hypothetical protein
MRDPAAGAIRPSEIRRTLHALVRPRLTGSAGAKIVADELRRRFGDLGYHTREIPFVFSTIPGRFGLPTAGLVAMAMGLCGGMLLRSGQPAWALAVLGIGLALAGLPLVLLGPALRRLPWGRVETSNLLFTRDHPRWLVMAHQDTKSQLPSTLTRTVAVAAALAGWLVLTPVAAATLAGVYGAAGPLSIWGPAGLLMAGGAVMAVSAAGNRSPGALDNGTGLAALLALAARVHRDVGFLVTDGEELGLAGARAVVGELPLVPVVNLDGLDDQGPVVIVEAKSRSGRSAGDVAEALLTSAMARGLDAVRRPLPPFIMVDHTPLARAGVPALTVLRGRWRSLLRVHRPEDTVDRLSGVGAADVAGLVASALAGLADRSGDTLRPGDASGHSPAQ